MIRTIKQRIYVVGLLPLAILAVALVVFNGLSRIDEANRELKNAQAVTAALLQSPALDALIVGNVLNFEQTVKNVIKTSPSLVCVTLRDIKQQTIVRVGTCQAAHPQVGLFPVVALDEGFSDFTSDRTGPVIGDLAIVMNDEGVVRKRRQVIVQLALSLVLIAAVLGLIGRLLRGRLIEPIQRIDSAMQALGRHDYNARVTAQGDDELARLAQAINATIQTIAAYTRELERRRIDADRALHDADEAHLARDGLVRSLTEDLEEPLSQMHSQLTAIAMANHDPALKGEIKSVIALLQKAQADFADLIDIATSTQGIKQSPPRDLSDILSDIERDVCLLSQTEGVAVHFSMLRMPDVRRDAPTGILLDVDAVRLKKALLYLIRSMSRRCKKTGVYVNVEFIKISDDELHVSIHLKAFYDPVTEPSATPWLEGLNRYGRIPTLVGWTDRETKIVDYLLRAVGISPTVSDSAGAVSILLSVTCRYTTAEHADRPVLADWTFATQPVSATLVSNDLSLMRLTRRGDMSNIEVKLVSFSRALANPSALSAQDALLIDISDDLAEAVGLIDRLKAKGGLPNLIAICPPGRMSESLGERLMELGFTGTLQKPLHYGRVIEVLRTTLSSTLKAIGRNNRPDQSGES